MQIQGGGGGGGSQQAIDLAFPEFYLFGGHYKGVQAVNCTAGLTALLNLTGRFDISLLWLTAMTANDITRLKCTIDGVVVWDNAPALNAASIFLVGGDAGNALGESLICNTSLLLELHMATDTSIDCFYRVRAIL